MALLISNPMIPQNNPAPMPSPVHNTVSNTTRAPFISVHTSQLGCFIGSAATSVLLPRASISLTFTLSSILRADTDIAEGPPALE